MGPVKPRKFLREMQRREDQDAESGIAPLLTTLTIFAYFLACTIAECRSETWRLPLAEYDRTKICGKLRESETFVSFLLLTPLLALARFALHRHIFNRSAPFVARRFNSTSIPTSLSASSSYLSKMPPRMPAEILKLRELISQDPSQGAAAEGAWDGAWRANVTPWDSKLKDVQPSLRELVEERWEKTGIEWESLKDGKALVAGCGRVSFASSMSPSSFSLSPDTLED